MLSQLPSLLNRYGQANLEVLKLTRNMGDEDETLPYIEAQ